LQKSHPLLSQTSPSLPSSSKDIYGTSLLLPLASAASPNLPSPSAVMAPSPNPDHRAARHLERARKQLQLSQAQQALQHQTLLPSTHSPEVLPSADEEQS
jgi:hypothetical protein